MQQTKTQPGADRTPNVADTSRRLDSVIARQQQEKRRIAAIGPKAPPRAKREPGKLSKLQQAAVRELLISELETIRRTILNKRRENLSWFRGYDSALSVINTRIEALK